MHDRIIIGLFSVLSQSRRKGFEERREKERGGGGGGGEGNWRANWCANWHVRASPREERFVKLGTIPFAIIGGKRRGFRFFFRYTWKRHLDFTRDTVGMSGAHHALHPPRKHRAGYREIWISFVSLPLRCDYPIVPTKLRKVDVEPLLTALALYSAATFDRPSSNPFHSRWIRTYDEERSIRILSTWKERSGRSCRWMIDIFTIRIESLSR